MSATITSDDGYLALSPVFAELGRAVFVCQCFEHSLVALHCLVSHEQQPPDGSAFQAAVERFSRLPLGTLLAELRKRVEVPSDVDEYLSTGIQMRNKVIHRFADEYVQRLFEPKGRLEVVQELAAIKQQLTERDNLIHELIDPLLNRHGSSVASLVKNADDLWDYLNPGLPNTPAPTGH